MKHFADADTIKKKMKLMFVYRRNMILDPQQSSNILSEFPRFKDVKSLVEQDFVLIFGEDTSSKLLERWPVTLKKKIIKQCRKLPSTSELEELLLAADPPEDGTELDVDFGWDSDLSSVLLLLHLIPPSAQGRKRPGKVSASQAEKHLVVFKKTGTNIQEHLNAITTSAQPYLLAVGVKKNAIHQFSIILNKNAIPCMSTSSLVALVYNIDVGKVKDCALRRREYAKIYSLINPGEIPLMLVQMSEFNRINKLFQQDRGNPFKMLECLLLFLRSLISRVVRPGMIPTLDEQLFAIDITDPSVLLPVGAVNYGVTFMMALDEARMESTAERNIKSRCRDFLVEVG
ncbi:uncharacterized protein LOC116049837 [Sander lucioperca]|uniref:uncharacterized protein LOC116049837 n=1 Tax=Sander lucioperca TaxID=283035 RepID=UPI00125DBEAC|nr:uncharacterized protein LOC116049837 [Sander lucioperca]